MGDPLVDIGRFLATPQYWISMLAAIFLIIGGIVFIVQKPAPPKPGEPEPSREKNTMYGIGAIILGVGVMFLARRWRGLVRTNDRYARIAGMLDVFNMFK